MAPLGIFPPSFVYFSGDFKKSTISVISSFAPSNPATSLKVTETSSLLINLAFDFPILKIWPPPPPAPPLILFIIKNQIPINIASGKIQLNISPNNLLSSLAPISTT